MQSFDFFQAYAKASLGNQPQAIAHFYAKAFIAADPSNAATFQNNEQFIKWLEEVHAFNQQHGMLGMTVVQTEDQPISEAYKLVHVSYEGQFAQTGVQAIPFKISYLLSHVEGDWKILCYISHEKQENAMKANGLL
ncbi:hypothetical protein LX64_02151 [Chitinophaga skermanii]|uniref:SnoaL-like protein n=1 Tax=Chitinophaga skermanii TaxID=331697 RepID=A0A327QTJ0_9BACT|nr:zinc ABC transporter substrate-binding protein [Chitinophaga skermanii]RAJ07022.1 hypothetical protein LX64_02151 [Chitinophaga skermanii]